MRDSNTCGCSSLWISLKNLQFVFIVVISFSLIQRGDSSNLKQCAILNNKYNLTHEQIQICRRDTSLFISLVNIGEGEGNLFKQECEYWMADERWNCTGVKAPLFQGTFQPWVNQLTKETAFVQAFTSALVFINIARGCAGKKFSSCSCAKESGSPPADSEWEACSENREYAHHITKKFLDEIWNANSHPDEQRMVHIHNLEAGRRVVTKNLREHCRCNGPTGTCSVKVCYRKVLGPREIGQILKNDMANAQKVKLIPQRTGLELHPPVERSKLICTKDSPSYCEKDVVHGALGVSGRECVMGNNNYFHHRHGECGEICCNGTIGVHEEQHRICRCTVRSDGTMYDCDIKCKQIVKKYFCR